MRGLPRAQATFYEVHPWTSPFGPAKAVPIRSRRIGLARPRESNQRGRSSWPLSPSMANAAHLHPWWRPCAQPFWLLLPPLRCSAMQKGTLSVPESDFAFHKASETEQFVGLEIPCPAAKPSRYCWAKLPSLHTLFVPTSGFRIPTEKQNGAGFPAVDVAEHWSPMKE